MMHKIKALLLGIALALATGGWIGDGTVGTSFGASYVGAGDVVSGATAWFGLRAYNAAYASGSNAAINLRRASDNHTCNLLITTSGGLGNTANCSTGGDNGQSAAAWAGTDITCSGSTTGSSTTLAVTGCSANSVVGTDPISGTGITQPAYVTSCSITAGTGTCTMNVAQNIAVAETVTFQVALLVTEIYDQSGSNFCSSAPCNVSQSTATKQPQLLPGCIGTQPCLYFNRTNTQGLSNSTTTTITSMTIAGVALRITAAAGNMLSFATGGGTTSLQFTGAANTTEIFLDNVGTTATETDGTLHSIIGVANGASPASVVNVDGTETTGSTGTSVSTAGIGFGVNTVGTNSFGGYMPEGGWWNSTAFTSTQRTNICKNAQSYYGSANFGAAC
jgi:hypothetical protein